MKIFTKRYAAVLAALFFVLAFALNVSAAPGARPDHDRDSRKTAPQQRANRDRIRRIPMPRPGQVHSRLPRGNWTVRHGRSRYYYSHGAFYSRRPSGYVVVKAPIGAIVFGLPLGYHRISVGGGLYFSFGGVYYRRVPSGYVVVEPPREVVVQEPAAVIETPDGQVTVTAERLNIRSGPGLDEAIVAQVSRGTVLTVQESTEDWWYVELPDGKFGWVLTRFTTPLQAPAEG